MVPRNAEQFNVRLPDGLREKIKTAARNNMRSMNSEIVCLLESGLSKSENEEGEASA